MRLSKKTRTFRSLSIDPKALALAQLRAEHRRQIDEYVHLLYRRSEQEFKLSQRVLDQADALLRSEKREMRSLTFAAWRQRVVVSFRSRAGRVARPPGWRLLSALEWIYSRKTMNGVFRPTILDMQHEHIEALAAGRHRKARWVLLRGYSSVVGAAFAQLPVSCIKLAVKLWNAAS